MFISIRAKLIAGFGAVLLLMGLVGYIGISSINSLSLSISNTYDNNLVPIAQIGEAAGRFNRMRVYVLDYAFADNKEDMTSDRAKAAEHEKVMLDQIDAYAKSELVADEKTSLATFRADWEKYKADREKLYTLKDGGKDAEAVALARSRQRDAHGRSSRVVGDGRVVQVRGSHEEALEGLGTFDGREDGSPLADG
jgi:methyl-accepting chemotaxis protein